MARKKSSEIADDIEKDIELMEADPQKSPVEFISTGCIPINLALSQKGRDGGVARGRIINLVGDGSSGKCCKNSYILTENGMELIDDIGEVKNFGLSEFVSEISVSSSQKDKTSHFWKEEVDKTIKITTRHGYEIECTPDHKIMVFENFDFKMKKAGEIKESDVAIIAKGSNFFSKENCIIPKYNGKLSPGLTVPKLPEKVNESFARLLGYIVADGNIYNSSVKISNTKSFIREDLKNITEEFGLNLSKQGISSIYLSNIISQVFGNCNNFTARNKFVPDCILKSTKEIQCNFIRALIDCDGWGNKSQLNYYSASEKLAKQIHLMLLNIGILGNINFKDGAFDGTNYHDHKYYKIAIYGEDLITYTLEIGTLKYKFNESSIRRSDFDTVPNLGIKIKDDLENLRNKLGWSKNGVCKNTMKRFPRLQLSGVINGSKSLIKRMIELFDGYDIDLSLYRKILESNYHFDPIVEVEHKDQKTIVYDVHIPENHLFWSNGFISHNTILALEICAWLYYNYKKITSELYPEIKKLIIVYNNSESVMDFPIAKMFGEEFYNFVEWTFIPTCEGFGRDIQKRISNLKSGECLLYIEDSIDASISESAKERIEKAIKSDKPEEDSYGLEMQKYFSQSFFKDLCSRQHGKDATVILISQVRENLKAGMFGKKFYRTGGKSLDFYTHQVLWLYHKEKMKKTFRGNERSYGVRTLVKVERNKTAIPFREADFPIIFDYGIDNVMAMADFLFGPKDKEIEWNEERMKKSELVNLAYENREILEAMIDEVELEWKEIEENIKTKRPSKY